MVNSLAAGLWVFSIVLGLSGFSVFGFWVSLELNLVCFIALLALTTEEGPWVTMKYFIVQSVASAWFLTGAVFSGAGVGGSAGLLILLGLLLKMAMAPLQFWLLNISNAVSWEAFTLISTVQKVLPLFGLIHFSRLTLSGVAIVGVLTIWAFAGLVTQLKAVLIYSSILGVSWMGGGGDFSMGLLFLAIYGWSFLMISVSELSATQEAQGGRGAHFSDMESLGLFIALMSMSGMPPFMGFFVKMSLLSQVMSQGLIFVALGLLLGSAYFIWVYARVFLSSLEWEGEEAVWGAAYKLKPLMAAWGALAAPLALLVLLREKRGIWLR